MLESYLNISRWIFHVALKVLEEMASMTKQNAGNAEEAKNLAARRTPIPTPAPIQ